MEGIPVSLSWSINLLPIQVNGSSGELKVNMDHAHPIRTEIESALELGVIPQHISFGVLYSDHVGYFSFDLSQVEFFLEKISCKLLGSLVEKAEKLANNHIKLVFSLTCPASQKCSGIRRDIPFLQLLGPLSFIDNPLTFNLEVDSSVPRIKQRLGQSIQNPDMLDWEISPKSFVGNPVPNLDNDNVINLLPSTHASREYYFHELSNSSVVTSLETKGLTGRINTHDAVDVLSSNRLSYITHDNLATTAFETNNQSPWMQGEVKEYRQTWFPQGHALGDILYSLALAPGESSEIAVIDWSREDTASRAEDTKYNESLAHMQRHDRMIDETVTGELREEQSGGSEMWGAGIAAGVQNAAEGVLLGMLKLSGASQLGITGGYGNVSTDSSGIRNLSGRSVQNIADQVVQNSSLKRGLRSTVIMQATQKEKNVLQTRTITNPNHGHALTVQYYEVLRHFKVVTEYVGKRDVLLIPFSPIDFDNNDNILRFRHVLDRVLLDGNFSKLFDSVVIAKYKILPSSSQIPSQSEKWVAEIPIRKITITFSIAAANENDSTNKEDWPHNNEHDAHISFTITTDQEYPSFKPFNSKLNKGGGPYQGDIITTNTGITRKDINVFSIYSTLENWKMSSFKVNCTCEDNREIELCNGTDLPISPGKTSFPLKSLPPKPVPQEIPQTEKDKQQKELQEKQQRETDVAILKQHLKDHKLYYSKAIWLTQDPQERAYLFGPYLSSLIENTPVAINGNYLAFPFVGKEHTHASEENQKETRIISLPTRGVFAEVFLSNNPGIEKRDITRYWNWMDSPVKPAPPIAEVQQTSPNAPLNTTPSNLPSPTVQIMNAPSVPDPVGLAGALKVLGTPDIFRDMSGINQVSSFLDSLISGAVDMAQAK